MIGNIYIMFAIIYLIPSCEKLYNNIATISAIKYFFLNIITFSRIICDKTKYLSLEVMLDILKIIGYILNNNLKS